MKTPLPCLLFSLSTLAFAQEVPPAPVPLPATDEGVPGNGPLRRADWFQKLWMSKTTQWAKAIQQDQGAVVFLGDSITQGWEVGLPKAFPGLKLANRGISGDTTRGMLLRLAQNVTALNPKAVVILAGTNDLEEHATPEVIAENLRLILAGLKAHRADMPVVLCKVFPSAASKSRPADKIQEINRLYQALVQDHPQVTVVETYKAFADAKGDAKADEFPDLLHPNDKGYAKWAAALRPVLATLGLVEREADSFTLEPQFRSLFNGKDLSGWQFKDQPPFAGKTLSSDDRYLALNGRLIVKTPPTAKGTALAQLWTTEQFGTDFTLRLQFRATPDADSGVFIRNPQLQCRDYIIAGPWKDLPNYKPQDWNDLEVIVRGTTPTATCNGDAIPDFKGPLPASGPIGLEGDRGQMEYRRIRIKTE